MVSVPPEMKPGNDNSEETLESFSCNRWFTRGWTLQELIAPQDVVFFDRDWELIGQRHLGLLEIISAVTKVDIDVLRDPALLSAASVARRLSWAAHRKTTRKEDEAYCLLGILGVNMPLLYGEGAAAFVRLQEEVIRSSTDQSIFVWNMATDGQDSCHRGHEGRLLATSPECFQNCGNVQTLARPIAPGSYQLTNVGVRITLPLVDYPSGAFLGVLNCHQGGRLLSLYLSTDYSVSSGIVGSKTPFLIAGLSEFRSRIVQLSHQHVAKVKRREVIICRHAPENRLRKKALGHISLWLRLSDVCHEQELRLENVFPENLWSFPTRDWRGDVYPGDHSGVAHMKVAPGESPVGGLVMRDGNHKARIVVCFTPILSDRHCLVVFREESPDLQACCKEWLFRYRSHYMRPHEFKLRPRIRKSLYVTSSRKMNVKMHYDYTYGDNDIELVITQGHTPPQYTKLLANKACDSLKHISNTALNIVLLVYEILDDFDWDLIPDRTAELLDHMSVEIGRCCTPNARENRAS